MTASAEPIWDEQRRLNLGAIAAVVGAFIAAGESDFAVVDVILLPIAAAAFVAKALRPELPNLVVAVPALVVPLTINIVNETDDEFSMFLLILGVMVVASIEDLRWLANGFAITASLAIFVLSVTGVYDWAWVNWISAVALGWAFGTAVYHYDRVLAQLRATQAELIDHAALVERRRIARDVHDLIGHSLSVVMLHVAGARRLIRSDPDEAEQALLQAEEASRASMAEVRRTVGLMRADDETDGSVPTPDLTDIETVIDQYRSAGMSIDYEHIGPIEEVEGPVALACHRIAQEALANVSKHTSGSDVEVDVRLEADGGNCHLQVRNRGGRMVTGTGQGHGLIGMRERAQSVGGSLLAGPVPGGWSVDVTVPIDRQGVLR